MAFQKSLRNSDSNRRRRANKRHGRSVSPKRIKNSKNRRRSLTPDSSCRYPLENKTKHKSRHVSPKYSHRHRQHRNMSPARRKVTTLYVLIKMIISAYVIYKYAIYIIYRKSYPDRIAFNLDNHVNIDIG